MPDAPPGHKLLDWMPWYATHFWGSVRVLRLSEAACNLYRWMLDYQWLHGSIPDDAVVVSRLYPWGATALDSWREVRPLFDIVDGALVNPKLAAIHADSAGIVARKSLGGKRSAEARAAKYGTSAPAPQKADAAKTLLKSVPNSTGTPDRTGPNLTGSDRTGPEKKKRAERAAAAPLSFVIPTSISTDDFRAVWALWIQYRREKKKPVTETGGKLQLDKCAAMGEARSIAALKHSMVMGWEGMWEPDARDAPGTIQKGPNKGQPSAREWLLGGDHAQPVRETTGKVIDP